MFLDKRIMLAQDEGGGNGGDNHTSTGDSNVGDDNKNTIQALQDEIKTLKEEKKSNEAKAAAEKKAKMTAEEKSKAEIDEMRKSLFEDHIKLQLKSAGLEDEFKPLFSGATVEEIKNKGDLIGKLIANVRASTEAEVKKAIAKTGAPGSGQENQEVSAEDYYAGLIIGQ